ncbi:unnamed protein product, partial [Didymodactylos carnosus]
MSSGPSKISRSLPHLQNLIKRDPEAYKEDFKLQYLNFESQFVELMTKPDIWSKTLAEQITFIAQVAQCYRDETKNVSQMFMDVLKLYSTVLNRDMRLILVRALILMRNRNLIGCQELAEVFFRLLRVQDRLLKAHIQTHIINDIKRINQKHKNLKLNSTLQNFMYTVIKENNPAAVKVSLDIMVDLYRKNIWNDAKTVNIIANTCFSKITKIQVAAVNFFLGTSKAQDENSDSDDDDKPTRKEILLSHRVGKKSEKRKKRTERALKLLTKQSKKKKVEIFNYSALHLLYDPQDFSEKLFRLLETSNERFEVKLLLQDLISRLIGLHHLILLNFYPYIQRYLQPHQKEVTKILLFIAQAAHDLVPPDILESVCKTIAMNFITERNSHEVMAVGLNTIREICSRSQLAMNMDLLHDLAKYKTYRDKSVSASARSLIQLFREKNPRLLEKKDRGKPTIAQRELKPLQYGESDAKTYLPGAELLQKDENNTKEMDESRDKVKSDESETDDDDDDDDEKGWIDVSHSDNETDTEENEENDQTNELPSTNMNASMAEDERISKAMEVVTSRILTQSEFEQLRVTQLKKHLEDKRGDKSTSKRKTITIDTDSEDDNQRTNNDELISLHDIERVHKKRRH